MGDHVPQETPTRPPVAFSLGRQTPSQVTLHTVQSHFGGGEGDEEDHKIFIFKHLPCMKSVCTKEKANKQNFNRQLLPTQTYKPVHKP